MGSQIDDLLNQKMDRKQFLKHVGVGLTAVVGLGAIVRAFQPQDQSRQGNVATGYGSSTYGGVRPSNSLSVRPAQKS